MNEAVLDQIRDGRLPDSFLKTCKRTAFSHIRSGGNVLQRQRLGIMVMNELEHEKKSACFRRRLAVASKLGKRQVRTQEMPKLGQCSEDRTSIYHPHSIQKDTPWFRGDASPLMYHLL